MNMNNVDGNNFQFTPSYRFIEYKGFDFIAKWKQRSNELGGFLREPFEGRRQIEAHVARMELPEFCSRSQRHFWPRFGDNDEFVGAIPERSRDQRGQ